MSTIDYHYETIGRVLAYLVDHGLRRVNLQTSDAMEIMSNWIGHEDEVLGTFNDVLRWMLEEGLIRAANISERMDGSLFLVAVQLTSKGIAVLQAKTTDPEIGESIEEKLTEAKGTLEPAVYTKIGSFVGGLLGGLTKSIGS